MTDPKDLMARQKVLRDPDLAERAVLNALKAMLKQSQALADADYATAMTIKQVRRYLDKGPGEMAGILGIKPDLYEKWESKTTAVDVAKAMAYTTKMIDETYRLLSFAQGGPDARTELTLGDLLKYLTAEQFEEFTKWIEEGKKRGDAEVRLLQ